MPSRIGQACSAGAASAAPVPAAISRHLIARSWVGLNPPAEGVLVEGFYVVLALAFALMVFLAVKQAKRRKEHDAELGVPRREIHRLGGVSYLGGHPRYADPIAGCTMIFTPQEAAIERGPHLLFRYPMAQCTGLLVETEEEATSRFTATRLLLVGVFALAFKKKKPGSVLITLDTSEGPLVFEKAKSSKVQITRALSRPMAMIRARAAGIAPSSPANPAVGGWQPQALPSPAQSGWMGPSSALGPTATGPMPGTAWGSGPSAPAHSTPPTPAVGGTAPVTPGLESAFPIPPAARRPGGRNPSSSSSGQCRSCGAEVLAEDRFCRRCGIPVAGA